MTSLIPGDLTRHPESAEEIRALEERAEVAERELLAANAVIHDLERVEGAVQAAEARAEKAERRLREVTADIEAILRACRDGER